MNGQIYHIQVQYVLDRAPDISLLFEQAKTLYGEPQPGLFANEMIWQQGDVSFSLSVRREKVTLVLSDSPTLNQQLAKVH